MRREGERERPHAPVLLPVDGQHGPAAEDAAHRLGVAAPEEPALVLEHPLVQARVHGHDRRLPEELGLEDGAVPRAPPRREGRDARGSVRTQE